MAVGLYGRARTFTRVMDTVFDLMGQRGRDLARDWRQGCSDELLDDVTRAQPLLHAVGYALGREVMSWGVRPAALLGHSVGEMAAATLAGVIDLDDAVRMMQDRVDRIAATPPGGMLAVACPAEKLEPYLSGQLAIAAVNAPRQTLLAGPAGDLATLAERLHADGITCRPARARQAFHSPAMAQALADSEAAWRDVVLRPPRLPIYSGFLAAPLPAATAVDPSFWASQPLDPVLFWPTLCRLLDDGGALLVEVGPGDGLSTLARQHRALREGRSAVTSLLPSGPGSADDDLARAMATADRIRAEGHPVENPFCRK
jgi:acyl transferase domain-containing protein